MSPHWLCCLFAALVVFASPQPAVAQIPASELPGRAREQFQQPRVPLSQPGAARITLPSTVAPPGAEKLKVRVRGVRITGSTIYSAEELAPLYQEIVGREVPVTAVYDIAQRITARYGSDGYVLSRAVVPPQELSPRGAVVHIQIIEGYIDRVEWPPALSKYRDFFSHYAAQITAERPINVKTLERYLLLASDLPGLKFTNSLKASPTNPGAATLVVEVVEKPVDAFARIDNRGTKARGPEEYFTSVSVNNLARMHESLTLSTAGAFQLSELQYYLASYRQVLTGEGLTIFFNNSYTRSKPGTETLRLLEYKTRGDLFEAGVLYPFIRSREKNLIATALFFMSNDRSDILDALNTLDKIRGVRLKADIDFVDPCAASTRSIWCSARESRGSAVRSAAPPICRGPTGSPTSPNSRRPSAACNRCREISPSCSPPMASGRELRSCRRSCAATADGPLGGLTTPRSWSGIAASSSWRSFATTSPTPSRPCRSFSSIRSQTVAGFIILPQLPGHLRTWMALRLEGDSASVCSSPT